MRRAPATPGAVGLSRRAVVLGGTLAALAPTVRAQELIAFDGLYKSFGVLGFEFSDRVASLRGGAVSIVGYMAPPLAAESKFFVLTRQPLAICPFCQSDADWPVDIVVVYLKGASPLVAAGARIAVSGRLDLGSWTDPETGFISQIRIVDARYHLA